MQDYQHAIGQKGFNGIINKMYCLENRLKGKLQIRNQMQRHSNSKRTDAKPLI